MLFEGHFSIFGIVDNIVFNTCIDIKVAWYFIVWMFNDYLPNTLFGYLVEYLSFLLLTLKSSEKFFFINSETLLSRLQHTYICIKIIYSESECESSELCSNCIQ